MAYLQAAWGVDLDPAGDDGSTNVQLYFSTLSWKHRRRIVAAVLLMIDGFLPRFDFPLLRLEASLTVELKPGRCDRGFEIVQLQWCSLTESDATLRGGTGPDPTDGGAHRTCSYVNPDFSVACGNANVNQLDNALLPLRKRRSGDEAE